MKYAACPHCNCTMPVNALGTHIRYRHTEDISLRFWAKVKKAEGDACWIWQGARSVSRYGTFSWYGTNINAHRAAWLITNGPIEGTMGGRNIDVLHTCGNGHLGCVRPSHLYLGTDLENSRDRINDGRHPSKLTVEQVREIKLALKNPYDGINNDLAAKYNIGAGAISQIRTGKQWKRVQV